MNYVRHSFSFLFAVEETFCCGAKDITTSTDMKINSILLHEIRLNNKKHNRRSSSHHKVHFVGSLMELFNYKSYLVMD
jgi:hypothetical protein